MTVTETSSTGVNPSRKSGYAALDVEDFINMMVTQLQNQDPLEPAKNEQLLSQMSQIGQLQSQEQLSSTMKGLVESNAKTTEETSLLFQQLALQSNIGSAGNMIGKSVSGRVSGDPVDGVVAGVNVKKGGIVTLELDNGKTIPLANVSRIADA